MEDEDRGGDRPCFADRLIGGHVVDPEAKRDLDRFRKSERKRLYSLRRTMPQEDRAAETARVIDGIDRLLGNLSGKTIAVYWPIRGELDLRPWMARLSGEDAEISLPVVVRKGQPVEFHRWTPGCRMTRGDWNIPVPAKPEPVAPDIVIVPLVGVDRKCFRLGNGGGYYDMTLAALDPRPRTVAVGQGFCTIPTILPQPWDIVMDSAILGDGSVLHAGETGQDR